MKDLSPRTNLTRYKWFRMQVKSAWYSIRCAWSDCKSIFATHPCRKRHCNNCIRGGFMYCCRCDELMRNDHVTLEVGTEQLRVMNEGWHNAK